MITAEEFIRNYNEENDTTYGGFEHLMIEFTKLHVKAALDIVSNKDLIIGKWGGEKVRLDDINVMDQDGNWMLLEIDKNSIINAYPKNLVK